MNKKEFKGFAFVDGGVCAADGFQAAATYCRHSATPERVLEIHVPAGTYYARMVLDANRNGLFDTGNLAERRHPETDEKKTQGEDLVYEWGGTNRLALPNTAETRAMFERLVLAAMGGTGQVAAV